MNYPDPAIATGLNKRYVQMDNGNMTIPEDIKSILYHVSHGVVIVKDGKIVFVNPRILEYTGMTEDEIVGKDFWGLTDEKHRVLLTKAAEMLMAKGDKPNPVEFPIIRKDGGIRHIRIDGTVIELNGEDAIMATAIDLTEKRDLIDRMRSIEEKYLSVLEHSPNNIYLVDMETMTIIESNSTLQDLLGYKAEELLGMQPYEFIAHENDDVNDHVRKLPDGEYGLVGHRKYRTKDGRLIDVEVSANVIDYRGRKTISVVSWDVTNLRNIQKELVQLNEVLQLVSRITRHDIRNKLTIAYGILGLMSGHHEVSDEYIREAYNAVRSAIDITHRMNELEKLSIAGKERMERSLKEIVEEVISEFPIGKSIEGDSVVNVDSAFNSVIENLIGNAVNHGSASRIDVRIFEDNGNAVLMISDNGTGIDESIRDRIFEESVSHGENKGSGLGLFIVRKVIERCGGKVNLEKTSPDGTTFRITIPK